MSNSSLCIEQRLKERQTSQKVLCLGIAGSLFIHSAMAVVLANWPEKTAITEDPMEVVIIEKPLPATAKVVPPPPPKVPQKPKVTLPPPSKATSVVKNSLPPKQQNIAAPLKARSIIPAVKPKFQQVTKEKVENNEPIPSQPPSQPLTRSFTPNSLTPSAPNRRILSTTDQSTATVPVSEEESPNSLANSSPVSSSVPLVPQSNAQPLANYPQNREQLKAGLSNNSGGSPSSSVGEDNTNSAGPISSNSSIASNSSPPKPTPKASSKPGLNCINQCEPAYPAVLQGAEGSAEVQLLVNQAGKVVSVTLSRPNSNAQINQQALLAARKMRFSNPPNGKQAAVQITVNFTVTGSEFDRQAKDRREQQQRERQAQLERKRQQVQLEQEREARKRQLEQERRERQITPSPVTVTPEP